MKQSDVEVKVPRARQPAYINPSPAVPTPYPATPQSRPPKSKYRKNVHFPKGDAIHGADGKKPISTEKRFSPPSPPSKTREAFHALRRGSNELKGSPVGEKMRCLRKLTKYFQGFTKLIGMHGIGYLSEKRTTVEKLFWMTILTLCCLCAIFFVYLTLQKYTDTKTIISFAMNYNTIRDVPFPAVTICSETKMVQKRFSYGNVRHTAKQNDSLTPIEYTRYCIFYMLCNFKQVENFGNQTTLDVEMFRHIAEVSIPENEWMLGCTYHGKDYNCSEIFSPIFLDEGLCYSFNLLEWDHFFYKNTIRPLADLARDSKRAPDWNEMDGYKSKEKSDVYPRRNMNVGIQFGLHLRLRQCRIDLDDCCRNGIQGYRVLMHSPGNWPRMSVDYLRVGLNGHSIAAVYPRRVVTSDVVKRFKLKTRLCYFPNEKMLKFFKIYTHSNCLLECFANFTRNKCGCVGHYMPTDKETKFCGSASRLCLHNAETEFEVFALQSSQSEAESAKQVTPISCQCLPQCTFLNYDIDYSFSMKNWSSTNTSIPPKATFFGSNYTEGCDESLVSIYFQKSMFRNLERNELFGSAEMIANLGGLIGIFTGLSLLSMVECIYFCTCRVICNRKLYHDWSGA